MGEYEFFGHGQSDARMVLKDEHGAPGGLDSVGAQVDEVAVVTQFVEQIVSGYIDEFTGDVVDEGKTVFEDFVGGDFRVEVMHVTNDECGFA